MKALTVFAGLLLGNLLVQFWKLEPHYLVAFERTYFQGVAVFAYWLLDKFAGEHIV